MKTTIEQVMTSKEFIDIATVEAVKQIAKKYGQSEELTMKAFLQGVEAVQTKVSQIIVQTAYETVKELNKVYK